MAIKAFSGGCCTLQGLNLDSHPVDSRLNSDSNHRDLTWTCTLETRDLTFRDLRLDTLLFVTDKYVFYKSVKGIAQIRAHELI